MGCRLSVVSCRLHHLRKRRSVAKTKQSKGVMKSAFENLKVHQLSEKVADEIWDLVLGWNNFAKDTVGRQLVRAADSIGANIAEGTGVEHIRITGVSSESRAVRSEKRNIFSDALSVEN